MTPHVVGRQSYDQMTYPVSNWKSIIAFSSWYFSIIVIVVLVMIVLMVLLVLVIYYLLYALITSQF